MLRQLYIKNYAIIDELQINFNTGLTVITGETGAGKSIMLDAISLVMGQRADSKVLKDNSQKCIVEANFDISTYSLEKFFAEHELDFDEELIVRRELSAKGKSRAFINDTPVRLKIMELLMPRLIDLHLQFENLEINDQIFQIRLLDTIAGTTKAVGQYGAAYKVWKADKKELETLIEEHKSATAEQDYLQFQLQELQEAQIVAGEEVKVESELKTQENVEEIRNTVSGLVNMFSEGDQPVLEEMRSFQYQLDKMRDYHADLSTFATRFESQFLELNDFITDLANWIEDLELDPNELEQNRKRLDQINQLLNKHQIIDTSGLLALQQTLVSKIDTVSNREAKIKSLEKKIARKQKELLVQAERISTKRSKAIKKTDKMVMDKLKGLKMSNARFQVDLQDAELNAYGNDSIAFLFSANPGSDLAPIKDVASGGELSRLSLITKSMAAEHMNLPTLVFDEVDSGVSGDVAQRMGALLEEISGNHQVVCITHSAQIAAIGQHHLFVSKKVSKQQTTTQVHSLVGDDRINHIAIMLSSDPPSESAILNARELLQA